VLVVRSSAVLALLCALGVACSSGAASDDGAGTASAETPQRVERSSFRPRAVVGGLKAPLHVAGVKGQAGRLYIVEQGGLVRIFERGRLRAAPFLDIRSLISEGSERGLLSIAFHPSYATNRRFYVNYTDRAGNTNVAEYRSSGTRAIPSSARRLLLIQQPYANHNGGHVAFGPNGRLYVGMGDGGGGGDPENRAQSLGSRLGKLLSIDVVTRAVRIEGLGLRNPWRISFDRLTGDLLIGDVGQGQVEEVNFTPKSSPGLENYGWDVFEGRLKFEDKGLGPGKLVYPIAEYSHFEGCSITGGHVYRGANRALRGRYIYGDYCSGNVWSFAVVDGKASGLRREDFKIPDLTSFGEDSAGELFAVSGGGTIFRLTP
jgi:glucose/arabinose dehydrogenase